MFPFRFVWFPIILIFLSVACTGSKSTGNAKKTPNPVPMDFHVHTMSPKLYNLVKKMGLPMAESEGAYTNLDTVFAINGSQKLLAISMAYIWGAPGFQGPGEAERVASENDHLHAQVAKYPGKAYGFFSVNPTRDYADAEIRRCADTLNLNGLKLHFDNSKVSLRSPDTLKTVRKIIDLATEKGLPVLLHFDNKSGDYGAKDVQILIEEILLKNPDTRIILAHLGTGAGFRQATKEILAEVKRQTDAHPQLKKQLWLDISGIVFPNGFRNGQIPPTTAAECEAVSQSLRKTGLDRFVFGSDFPVIRAQDYLEVLREHLSLKKREIDQILNNPGPFGF